MFEARTTVIARHVTRDSGQAVTVTMTGVEMSLEISILVESGWMQVSTHCQKIKTHGQG